MKVTSTTCSAISARNSSWPTSMTGSAFAFFRAVSRRAWGYLIELCTDEPHVSNSATLTF